MKCLDVVKGKGMYSVDGEKWSPLDEISKEDIMTIINIGMSNGFEMCDPEVNPVENKVHSIIYEKLYEKFLALNANRGRFVSESEELFRDAFKKYGEQGS